MVRKAVCTPLPDPEAFITAADIALHADWEGRGFVSRDDLVESILDQLGLSVCADATQMAERALSAMAMQENPDDDPWVLETSVDASCVPEMAPKPVDPSSAEATNYVNYWIGPYGDVYPVPAYKHANVEHRLIAAGIIPKLEGGSVHDSPAMLDGWLRVSGGSKARPIFDLGAAPTQRQLDAVFDLAVAHKARTGSQHDRFAENVMPWLGSRESIMQNPSEPIADAQHASPIIQPELEAAADRAVAAGAHEPLEYTGAGMFGIVFRDAQGLSYKVWRHMDDRYGMGSLVDEAEWLAAANQVPEVEPHVVDLLAVDYQNGVLVREHIDGFPGTWSLASRLMHLHREIEVAMIPNGWGAPEFKENSYIFRASDGQPILVDASMANRFGHVLLQQVREILLGQRSWFGDQPRDLAFYLRSEVASHRLEQHEVDPLLDALAKLGTRGEL